MGAMQRTSVQHWMGLEKQSGCISLLFGSIPGRLIYKADKSALALGPGGSRS